MASNTITSPTLASGRCCHAGCWKAFQNTEYPAAATRHPHLDPWIQTGQSHQLQQQHSKCWPASTGRPSPVAVVAGGGQQRLTSADTAIANVVAVLDDQTTAAAAATAAKTFTLVELLHLLMPHQSRNMIQTHVVGRRKTQMHERLAYHTHGYQLITSQSFCHVFINQQCVACQTDALALLASQHNQTTTLVPW